MAETLAQMVEEEEKEVLVENIRPSKKRKLGMEKMKDIILEVKNNDNPKLCIPHMSSVFYDIKTALTLRTEQL